MQVYIVGGAVRDELLNRPVADRDFVVVGASPEDMLKKGFKPVGKDFPVFLHPETHEEYALARTERKSGHGYHGFTFYTAPDVTLEDDLIRRDLTINAMAKAEDGTLVDPFGGQKDLQNRLLRHVGPAFAEDPVRILRIARFAARLPNFTVAAETLALMQSMVSSGEVDHLVPERIWQEFAKGLMEEKPSRMFDVLRACGALARLLPEVDALFGIPQRADYHPEIDCGIHTMMVIDQSARYAFPLPVRFAALTHDFGKALTPAEILPSHHGHEERSVTLVEKLCPRLRIPNDCRDLALLVARFHTNIHHAAELKASSLVRLLERTDALRRPERFQQILDACLCDYTGRLGWEDRVYEPPKRMLTALAAANSINAREIAENSANKTKIPEHIHSARIEAVKLALNEL